jgi:hypothetical protein
MLYKQEKSYEPRSNVNRYARRAHSDIDLYSFAAGFQHLPLYQKHQRKIVLKEI